MGLVSHVSQSTAACDVDDYNAGVMAGGYSLCLQKWSQTD